MPIKPREMTALEVKHLGMGTFNIGGVKGLYIRKTHTQSLFIFRYTDKFGRHDFSLGNYPTMSVAQAREAARAALALVMQGESPILKRQQEKQLVKPIPKKLTFRNVAEEWIADRLASNYWAKNSRGEKTTRAILEKHVFPTLGNLDIESISAEQIRECLAPIWQSIPATAKKAKTYIGKIFQWAIALHKRKSTVNPADWEGSLGVLMEPFQNNLKPTQNHAACAVSEIPRLFAEISHNDSMSAYACLFAILTCARSQAVRLAKWEEIDFKKKIWLIPQEHDKVKSPNRDRTIFLSSRALTLLRNIERFSDSPFIFPSRQGGCLSDNALTMFLRGLHDERKALDGIGWIDPVKTKKLGKPCVITLHGTARATFRTWAKDDETGNNRKFDQEAVELCLLHSKNDAYNGAYDRAPLTKERQKIMQAWGEYCWSKVSTVENKK